MIALLAQGLAGCTQLTPTEQMIKDLDYLNKKIQRQFDSFTPIVKDNFQSEIATIKSNLSNLKPYEFPCEIMRVLSMLKDGHTELNIGQLKVGFHRLPLLLYNYEGDFRVVGAHENYAELLGAKIVSISDTPIDEVFATLKKRMSADNDKEYLHAGPGYLILTELLACMSITNDPQKARVSFESTNGDLIQKNFEGLTAEEYQNGNWRYARESEPPLYLSNRKDSYWYHWLAKEGVMYVHISRLNNQKGTSSIKKFTSTLFEEVDQKRPFKLIIDVRLNNGGNYNLSRPIVEAIKEREWLNQKGKLWMITGRRTFSAASAMAIFLIKETEVTLIGESGRTHPNQADNNEYMSLPYSDYLIEYTTKIKKHWPERPQLTMIPVDIEILPDFESYRQGRGIVMEYILKQ